MAVTVIDPRKSLVMPSRSNDWSSVKSPVVALTDTSSLSATEYLTCVPPSPSTADTPLTAVPSCTDSANDMLKPPVNTGGKALAGRSTKKTIGWSTRWDTAAGGEGFCALTMNVKKESCSPRGAMRMS